MIKILFHLRNEKVNMFIRKSQILIKINRKGLKIKTFNFQNFFEEEKELTKMVLPL